VAPSASDDAAPHRSAADSAGTTEPEGGGDRG
jgi:hypothetical protein